MPLDPWIIEEILRREREKREEQERQQPTLEIEEPMEEKPGHDDAGEPGHEMPVDRKPGHEMPNPNESPRPSDKKKDDEPKRGVDISRITGSDDDDDDDGSIVIDISKLPKLPPEGEEIAPIVPKTPEKKPD